MGGLSRQFGLKICVFMRVDVCKIWGYNLNGEYVDVRFFRTNVFHSNIVFLGVSARNFLGGHLFHWLGQVISTFKRV